MASTYWSLLVAFVAIGATAQNIVRVSMTSNGCDSTCLGSQSYTVTGNPVPTNVGSGYLLSSAIPTSYNDFVIQNHKYLSPNVPHYDVDYVTFEFSSQVRVSSVLITEHTNGIGVIEGFVGDSEDALASIGTVVGSLGQVAFPEFGVNTFTFDPSRLCAGKIFRAVFRWMVASTGYGMYRLKPQYTSASSPSCGANLLTSISAPTSACDSSCLASAAYTVSGLPPPKETGIGWVMDNTLTYPNFVLQNHQYDLSSIIMLSTSTILYQYAGPVAVGTVLLVESTNGVTLIECFVGNDPNNMQSVGIYEGSLGGQYNAASSYFAEYAYNFFTISQAAVQYGVYFKVRLVRSSSPAGYALHRVRPILSSPGYSTFTVYPSRYITQISLTEGLCDAQCRSSSLYTVTGFPINPKVGAGAVIDPLDPTGGYINEFSLHDHHYWAANVPDFDRDDITYYFNDAVVVSSLIVRTHTNGVATIEGFAGDSLTTLTSVGIITGSLGGGGVNQPGFFAEYATNYFTFDPHRTCGAKIFRVVIKWTINSAGWALYRIYPQFSSAPSTCSNNYIAQISAPTSGCDATPCLANQAFTVTGSPPASNFGIGNLLSTTPVSGSYTLHNHQFVSSGSQFVLPSTNYVTYKFSGRVAVHYLIFGEHANGITVIEALVGDDPNNLVSIGQYEGSLGGQYVNQGSYFVDGSYNIFTFRTEAIRYGTYFQIRLVKAAYNGGYALYTLRPIITNYVVAPAPLPHITTITMPDPLCDAYCMSSSMYAVEGDPVNPTVGAGYLINVDTPISSYNDFAMHEHQYASPNVPVAASSYVIFGFGQSVTVTNFTVIEHTNGVARFDGYAGDNLNSLTYLGSLVGSLGGVVNQPGFFQETAHNLFTIAQPHAGKYFKLVVTWTVNPAGWALYRILPNALATSYCCPEAIDYCASISATCSNLEASAVSLSGVCSTEPSLCDTYNALTAVANACAAMAQYCYAQISLCS